MPRAAAELSFGIEDPRVAQRRFVLESLHSANREGETLTRNPNAEPPQPEQQPELPPTRPDDPAQPEPPPLPPDAPTPNAPVEEPGTPKPAGDPPVNEPTRLM